MELKFKTTDAEVCLCRETSFTADALRAGSESKCLAPVGEISETR